MRILFIDVETETIDETEKRMYQGFRLACCNLMEFRIDRGWRLLAERDFYDAKELCIWCKTILRSQTILYIISANIWFDMRNSDLFLYLVKQGIEVKNFYQNGLMYIIKMQGHDYTVILLNMQQFVPVSVKRMGELIGLPKLDTDVHTQDMEELLTYCRRDCDIITKMFQHWVDFIKVNDMGKFCFTLASQAFTAYRHRFMHKEIWIHANPYITKLERSAFYGGRVELFHKGTIEGERLYKLDINSMYPYMMKSYPMPVKWIGTELYPGMIKTIYHLMRHVCFARVAINTDVPAYPKRLKNKLVFPVGRFVTFLAHPELLYAYEHGHIEDIEYLVTYKKAVIFDEYVEHFYRLRKSYRKTGDKVFEFICKRMMNSLFGKFGQKIDRMILEEHMDEERYESNTIIEQGTNKRYKEVFIGKRRRVYEEGVQESFHSFTAIPAMITSLGRNYLWRLIKQAGRENVFYCDTDSLFTNREGFNNLRNYIDQTKLGMLSVESESRSMTLHGLKDYIFGDDIKIKGIKRGIEPNSDGSYDVLEFPGFKGDMKHGLDKPYSIIKKNKRYTRKYDKGEVTSSGKVVPFTLSEF